jgi:hypothetical protein
MISQLSKEVKKIKNFEQGLLAHYQAYLQSLEHELKGIWRKHRDIMHHCFSSGLLYFQVVHRKIEAERNILGRIM